MSGDQNDLKKGEVVIFFLSKVSWVVTVKDLNFAQTD